MLDNETIRALELCMGNGNCAMCPEKTSTSKCINNLMKDALKLINSQKALIKRLTSGKCVYLSDDETTEYCVEGPCPNYKTEAEIKAEAYKECIEKVKEKSRKTEVVYVDEIISIRYAISNKNLNIILKELECDNNV